MPSEVSVEEERLANKEKDDEQYWSSKAAEWLVDEFSTDPWHMYKSFAEWRGLWEPTRSKLEGLTPQDIFKVRDSPREILELLNGRGVHERQQTLILKQVEKWNNVHSHFLAEEGSSHQF